MLVASVIRRVGILRGLATALPSISTGRAITYCARRQPPLNLLYLQRPLTNQPTIGAALRCLLGWCRRLCPGSEPAATEGDSMDVGEQQKLVTSQEASERKNYGTDSEAVGGSREDEPQNGVREAGEGGSGLMAAEDNDTAQPKSQGESGGQEDSGAKSATSDPEGEAAVEEVHARNGDTIIDEAATAMQDEAKLDEIDRHRVPEQAPKEQGDKTPPPEEPKEVEEGSKGQTPPPENSPPEQTEEGGGAGGGGSGGGLGFFSQLRRGFSSGPKKDRQYYESLSLEEKRKEYTCGRGFVTLDQIETWEEFRKKELSSQQKPLRSEYAPNLALNEKVSLWRGDITKLEIGAIVNAANRSLLGGGGVDGAIHRAAGHSLKEECATLHGCDTGDAKLTSGHRLPAKYVLHTVGPINGSERSLRSCYERCLQLVLDNDIRSVAFCCIATGVYGYPNRDAAHVALETTRKWLETHADSVDRIIFCVFLNVDYNIYCELLQQYFPPETPRAWEKEGEGEEVEGSTGETRGEGSPATPVSSGDKEPAPTGEEREQLPTERGEVERDVLPILQKSITEPVPRVHIVPPESYSKAESDETTEAVQKPPSPGTGTQDSKEADGGDTGTSAAAASMEEGEEKGGEEVEGLPMHGHEGVRRIMDNKDDEGAPLSKRPKLDEAADETVVKEDGEEEAKREGEPEKVDVVATEAGEETVVREEEGEGEKDMVATEAAEETVIKEGKEEEREGEGEPGKVNMVATEATTEETVVREEEGEGEPGKVDMVAAEATTAKEGEGEPERVDEATTAELGGMDEAATDKDEGEGEMEVEADSQRQEIEQ